MNRDKTYPEIRVTPPGPNAKQWADFHLKNACKATYIKDFIWDRNRPAIGPFCQDVDGNVFIDMVSHVGTSILGYNNPELISISKHLSSTDPDRYAGLDFIGAWGPTPSSSSVPTPSHLQEKLLEITAPFGFDTVFLTNTGAEAVENAIKICWNKRKNNGYGICFDGAFHGRSLGALSLNRSKQVHRSWFPQVPKIVSYPFCDHRFIEPTVGSCDCWTKILKDVSVGGIINPDEVAFIIIEPIQGEGGYRLPNENFIQSIFNFAKTHGIPVIADEIQCGLGRTGKWWAIENFPGCVPDLITIAKPLRVGAVIGKAEMFPQEEYRISSTWGGGNAISSAIGYKTINIIQRDCLLENAKLMGDYIRISLSGLRDYDFITDIRGIGLMIGIEFSDRIIRDMIVERSFKEDGLLTLGCGQKTLRLLPPVDIKEREANIVIDILYNQSRTYRG